MLSLVSRALSRRALPLLVTVAALTAFALGYLGKVSAPFDMIAQFTAHWLIVAVIALAASYVPRRAYAILAASVAVAVGGPLVVTSLYAAVPDLPPLAADASSPQAAPKPRANGQFTLIAFNTYNHNQQFDQLWEEIMRHDADVVLLMETAFNKAPLLRRLEQHYPHARTCTGDWDCAIAVFSRLPVDNFKVVSPRDDAGPSLIAADLEVGGRPLRIIATHVISPNHGPRANFIELDHLAGRVAARDRPVVVAGDFNTTLWANAFTNFRIKSGLVHMGALIPTWPARPLPLPQIGIDHVFTSSELQVTDVRAGRAAGSDHLPLVATIEWRRPTALSSAR